MKITIPCPVCEKKFAAENGREPTKNDLGYMNRINTNETMCQDCYRIWAFGIAGIQPPDDYQTFDQAFKAM